MRSNRRPDQSPAKHRDAVVAVACVATLTLGAAGLFGAAAALPGDPVIRTGPAPVGRTLDFTFDAPTPTPEAAAAVLTSRTPADDAVAVAVSDEALAGHRLSADIENTLTAGPLDSRCSVSGGPQPVVAATRRTSAGSTPLTVTAAAYPAGGGNQAHVERRDALYACGLIGVTGAATTSGVGYALGGTVAGNHVTYLSWNRGDVGVAVTSIVAAGGSGFVAARGLADQIDAALLAHLAAACPGAADPATGWARNPYQPAYTPYSVTEALRVDLPAPAPTRWVSQPDGGVRDDAAGAAQIPAAAPVLELAPPVLPAGWLPGDPVPALEDAERGAAPVLVDPAQIVVPADAVVSSPTPAPVPLAPDVTGVYPVAQRDRTGPGCGWAFTDQPAPPFQAAAAKNAARAAARAAFWDLTTSAARHQLVRLEHVVVSRRYELDLAQWRAEEQDRATVASLQVTWQQAQSAYAAEVAAYQLTYQQWLDAQLPPVPEPTDPVPPVSTDPATPAPTPAVPSDTAAPSPGTDPTDAP